VLKSGFPSEEGDYRKTKEFDMQLINLQVMQLKGRIKPDREDRTAFNFVFSSHVRNYLLHVNAIK